MGKMKEFLIDVQEMILKTEKSYQEIADYFGLPLSTVMEIAEDLGEFDD